MTSLAAPCAGLGGEHRRRRRRRRLRPPASRGCAAPPGTWRSARPNCERSSAHCTDWSRMCSSAPAICCSRAAAPKRWISVLVDVGRRATAIGIGAVERHSVARLAGEALVVADRQARRRRPAPPPARPPRWASTAMWPALRANGTCRARPREPAVGAELDMAVVVHRRDRHRPGRRRDPGARQQPAGDQGLGERHRRGKTAGDAQHREAVGHRRRRRRRARRGPRRRSARILRAHPTAPWATCRFRRR